MQSAVILPGVPAGKIKSFGEFGEQYEVIKPIRPSQDGDWWIEIELVKTGERAEYPLSHLLEDPDGI